MAGCTYNMENLQKNDKVWIVISAAVLGLSAVALGAFGAHLLKSTVPPERLATWQTGIEYQMFHTLALLAVYLLYQNKPARQLELVALCMTVGIAIFSGSLYLLVLTGITWLGAITPIGGMLMIAGWALLLFHYSRNRTV